MPQKAREVKSALESKGFKKAKGGDHEYFWLHVGGKKTQIRTKMSHGESEIHDKNCGLMARQMKIPKPKFDDFVSCDVTSEEYLRMLIQAGHITQPAKKENPSS